MSKRRLRADEKELWDQVARSTVPLHPKAKPPPILEQPSKQEPRPMPEPIPAFEVGSKPRQDTCIPTPSTPPPRMDAKAFRKLSRGKLEPEGRIDLHGMRVDEAHPELISFILRSHAQGRRLVLVITGKGSGAGPDGPLPYQRGILRRQVPHWLRQNPVAPLILETRTASLRHGGEGALYVYLRRRR
ncbi:MAG: Smr/MutS family protein [Pseudomonadota bacterium]